MNQSLKNIQSLQRRLYYLLILLVMKLNVGVVHYHKHDLLIGLMKNEEEQVYSEVKFYRILSKICISFLFFFLFTYILLHYGGNIYMP